MTLLEEYKAKKKELHYLSDAVGLMSWDLHTITPEGGKAKLSDSISYFSTEHFKKATSDEYYNLVCKLAEENEYSKLDDVYKHDIRITKRDLDRSRRIPADFYEEYVKTTTNSSILWPKAKQTNDFGLFAEPLSKTIAAVKKLKSLERPELKPYDALIDDFEEGMTQETIDRVFGELKEALIPLLDKILSAPQPDHSKFQMKVPAHKQAALCKFLAEYMGIDMERFAIAESEHPFTTNMGTMNDVRITNHYFETESISAIFSAIHEAGHAIFEQNVDPKYEGTCGGSLNLYALHESQSRFYENMLGRNINFWKPIWPKILEIVPEYKDITLEEFVREINHVQNDLIRTEADELTYCMHIILRYELERAIFIDDVDVKDLPKMWNDKMKELLNVVPSSDSEGILQDMHWSDGSFGYFPSYLLGSIYDGMFLEAIEKDLGSIDDILAAGDIKKITKWLNTNIHQYGSTRISSEVLKEVCGKELSAKPLIDYFTKKYTQIYSLS